MAYNHPGNQIASLVGLTMDAEDIGKQVAMQVAAMNPIALDQDSVVKTLLIEKLKLVKNLLYKKENLLKWLKKLLKED